MILYIDIIYPFLTWRTVASTPLPPSLTIKRTIQGVYQCMCMVNVDDEK